MASENFDSLSLVCRQSRVYKMESYVNIRKANDIGDYHYRCAGGCPSFSTCSFPVGIK